jgi:3-oxoacyl-[acyl-carrier protein] reductase
MSKRFEGKHVLVTGAARGIGFEIARQFGKEGARLSLVDREETLLEETTRRLREEGNMVESFQVDVARRSQVFEAVEEAERIAPIDVLVNNAGVAYETPFLTLEEAEWREVLDINLTGIFLVAQAVSRQMVKRRSGVILNMSSKNGIAGEFGYSHYNASKGGIIMLTKTMALELAHLGIRVNAICPGYLVTPMSAEIDSPEFVANFVDRYIPVNRHGTVEDVAPLFLFLASDEASFITGETFLIDGGQLAGQKPGPELLAKLEIT